MDNELSEPVVKQLVEQGESGMGWQLCELALADGQVKREVIVANCSIVITEGGHAPSFSAKDVVSAKVVPR